MAAAAPSGTGRSECCAQTARLLAAAPGARPRPGDAWTCDHIEAVINGGVGTSRLVKRSGPKMYNLLMVARDGLWNEVNVSSFEYDRFMSYTHEALKARFLPYLTKLSANWSACRPCSPMNSSATHRVIQATNRHPPMSAISSALPGAKRKSNSSSRSIRTSRPSRRGSYARWRTSSISISQALNAIDPIGR
jgi:hypothetical protein